MADFASIFRTEVKLTDLRISKRWQDGRTPGHIVLATDKGIRETSEAFWGMIGKLTEDEGKAYGEYRKAQLV